MKWITVLILVLLCGCKLPQTLNMTECDVNEVRERISVKKSDLPIEVKNDTIDIIKSLHQLNYNESSILPSPNNRLNFKQKIKAEKLISFNVVKSLKEKEKANSEGKINLFLFFLILGILGLIILFIGLVSGIGTTGKVILVIVSVLSIIVSFVGLSCVCLKIWLESWG